MSRRRPKHVLIDQLAVNLRKPSARPLVEPAEAVAIALSMGQPGPARLISPDGPLVRLILLSIRLAGYSIEPTAKERS
ncbi:hypothetical protein ACQR1Y_12050 [Bradyrhizobium sp. HKCCYLRH3099]|uniref:hypothetical protein n=1 Tax=unclassified Bradyrhizobium TaxID=2631580 RepID=UPI003EBB8C50